MELDIFLLYFPNKYVGIDINKSLLIWLKVNILIINFIILVKRKLKKYKNKINYILINNVIHHLNKNN